MDLTANAYLAALILGAVHAIEVDHMVAVSVFAGFKPRLKAAAGYGARWGLGHAMVVVLVGAALAGAEIRVPNQVVGLSEVVVGFALIGLGIWALRRGGKFHAHLPKTHRHGDDESPHGHLHAHNGEITAGENSHHHEHHHHNNSHRHHQHLPAVMGALHGLAGSAPVLALIPITLLNSFEQALIYLLLFSVGTTVSMTLYAGLAAVAMHSLSLSEKNIVRLTMGIALTTIAVGIWWVISATITSL